MPVPSPRNKILPARGLYADLLANVSSLLEGEICYATDQDTIYFKEGGVLVATSSESAVNSVNGKIGEVVLTTSDLANDSGYITSAEAPVQPGDLPTVPENVSAFTNDSGYITSADVPPSYDDSAIDARLTTVEGVAGTAIQPGTVNPVYFVNQAAFPDAVANHGAVAHSHADGAMYFAHGGGWQRMANEADIPPVNDLSLAALPELP